jgi:hypothetical protein
MARDADGEVWVERGGQLTTLNPHRKVRFDAMRLTSTTSSSAWLRPTSRRGSSTVA